MAAGAEAVVDASVILAFLRAEQVGGHAADVAIGAWISPVNLAEVLTRLRELGLSQAEAEAAVAPFQLRVAAFDETSARQVAALRPATRHAGLSLGDRACLAAAQRLSLPAVTVDRSWAALDVGVQIRVLR